LAASVAASGSVTSAARQSKPSRLVATGLTNRQAAAELFASVKTVEYHLRHCHMKLDITSRRALASLIG
jgi:DNA-binding NarL/FixJ family response regulator